MTQFWILIFLTIQTSASASEMIWKFYWKIIPILWLKTQIFVINFSSIFPYPIIGWIISVWKNYDTFLKRFHEKIVRFQHFINPSVWTIQFFQCFGVFEWSHRIYVMNYLFGEDSRTVQVWIFLQFNEIVIQFELQLVFAMLFANRN